MGNEEVALSLKRSCTPWAVVTLELERLKSGSKGSRAKTLDEASNQAWGCWCANWGLLQRPDSITEGNQRRRRGFPNPKARFLPDR
jgi:hypothetical protein